MGVMMVFSPYVDEVVLSFGGLIVNQVEAGDRVIAVPMIFPSVPCGRTKENPYAQYKTEKKWIKVATKEMAEMGRVLGIEKIIPLNYRACEGMLYNEEVVDKVTSLIDEHQPDIAVTHWPVGNWSDINASGTLILRVLIERKLKKMPQVFFSETIFGSHTLCFTPDVYVDITKSIEKKRKACACIWEGKVETLFYEPHNLEVAKFRGRECGVKYAEAYVQLYGGIFGYGAGPGVIYREDVNPMQSIKAITHLERKKFICVKGSVNTEEGVKEI